MSGSRAAGAFGALALMLAGCTGAPVEHERVPVVVDTDMGQDDAMALLFLLQAPAVRVEAITVSGTGLAHCDAGVRNVLGLLEVANAPDDLPVACGPEEPLPGTSEAVGAFPDEWRAASDGFYGVDLPNSDRKPAAQPGPRLLATSIGGADGPVRLLTLGPLTNVALALRAEPDLVDDIERIVIMGGAVGVPGNAIENPLAEFNVWVDPVAAQEVLSSGAPIDLVPLDATNDVPVTPFFADALRRHHVTAEADVVRSLFDALSLDAGGYFFWDPLAAAITVDRSLATFEDRRIGVLEGKPTIQGWTVNEGDGARVHVAAGADALAFERTFLDTLNGDHAVGAMRPEPVATASLWPSGCTWDGPPTLPVGLAAVSLDAAPNAPRVLAVVRLLDGHTPEDLDAWLAALDYVVHRRTPAWITPAAFFDATSGTLGALRLAAGPHVVVCGDQAGRVEIVDAFDVAA